MKTTQRKSLFRELNENLFGKDSYIEVTEWTNGEGWDVALYTNGQNKLMSLHYGELDILTDTINQLRLDGSYKD